MEILFVVIGAILLCVAFYLFLICPRVFGKPERTAFYGVHYAHRGLFNNDTEIPENSLAAIRKAVKAGYGIEFDVQLSKDNVPVVFHDANLKRMCGIDGMVWEYTMQELQQMRLAKSQETIPTLKSVLKEVDGKVPLIVEYKMDRVDTKVCELGNALLQSYQGPYCIESFHPLAVQWYRKHRPNVMRGQLSENFGRHGRKKIVYWIMTHLLSNVVTRPDFIAYRHDDADNISRRICKRLGALAVAWTIRNQEEFKKAQKHFDLFIFDSCILENPVGEK